MIKSESSFDREDGLLSPPAKRQRLSLCSSSSPIDLRSHSPFESEEYLETSDNLYDDQQLQASPELLEVELEVPFTIKWNQHPEVPFPHHAPHINQSPSPTDQNNQPSQSQSLGFPCARRCLCCLTPKQPSSFSDLLQSMPLVDTTYAEQVLAPIPYPFPELSLEAVVSILNSCAPGTQPNFDPRAYPPPPPIPSHIPIKENVSSSSSLSIEGPYSNTWYVSGLLVNTQFIDLRNTIENLICRCRRDSDINARFTMIMEDSFKATVGEQIKGKLWDITPEKISLDLYNQLSKFSSYLQGSQLFIKASVYLQEPTVKLLSDNDVKKKRSVITIYEKEEASLIYAFYVAVRRNIIVKEKKATNNAKKKKELENQLTNVYRKGRKSLKKKTQSVLDKNKVIKTVDDHWGFPDIPLLEMKLGVRCVVFSSFGKCLYEGGYEYQNNEIDLLCINNKFHVLASRNVFRNYNPSLNSQTLKLEPSD